MLREGLTEKCHLDKDQCTGVENKFMDTKEGGRVDELGDGD